MTESPGLHVALRADASRSIGVGHAMRSLTLGAALLERGCAVTLVSSELIGNLRERSGQMGIPVLPIAGEPGGVSDAQAVADIGCGLVVVDGYFFSDCFFSELDSAGVPYMVIDDNGELPARGAIAVLNQNPHARQSMYLAAAPTAHLLLGLRYSLIRREVRSLRDGPRGDQQHPVALVAIGGTDALGITGQVIETLHDLDERVEFVAAGTFAPARARRAAPDIAQDLAASTLAVIGAGTTMWEASCLGVPTVSLVVADNQEAAAIAAHEAGVVRAVDCRRGLPFDELHSEFSHLVAEEGLRSMMSREGRRLVDGKGADRVAAEIVELLRVGEQR